MRGAGREVRRGATARRNGRGLAWCARLLGVVVATVLALAGAAGELRAQNIVSVPFTKGFIGPHGSNDGSVTDGMSFATLGIARVFFIQNSSKSTFEYQGTQGNDIPGTLRIVRTNGTTLDVPAAANWRNNGNDTYLIGFLAAPASPITFAYGSGSSIQITKDVTTIGGYVAAYAGSTLADHGNTSGNAAMSAVLSGLNSYLSTVVASRPAGPVTVTAQTTASTTPTIAGTATLATNEALSVVVNGVQFTATTTPAIVQSGTAWSLTLTSALAAGTYDVAATITNVDGFTLSDGTTNELVVTRPAVTIGGSFTANDRTYDATTAATGNTTALTLGGVSSGDDVSIAAVTLGFQTAAAGTGKTVVITGVTLGGANAAQYSVSLTGAPTATASIAAKALTVGGVSAASRAYDGTTTATLTGTAAYAGLVGGQSFAVTGTPAASFASATVGTGKAVTVTGYTAPSANYTVTQPSGLTASITRKTLTIGGAFTVASKVEDGTTAATIVTNGLTLPGVVGGDVVALSVTATFATATAGTGQTVTLSSASITGADMGNYTITLAGAPTTTADITRAGGTVTIGGTFTANDRTYDGTTAATGSTTGLTLAGVNASDDVTIASVTLAFGTAAVGSAKTVTITGVTLGGTSAAQYGVSLTGAPTATASITPRPLTIGGSFTAASKTYDRTTSASIVTNGLTLTGVVGGETVALGGVSALFATPTVGTNKTVVLSAAGLTGAAAANYTVSVAGAPTATAAITLRTLTVAGSFTAPDKIFDGSATATIGTSSLRLVGALSGDDVALGAVGAAFADATVGTAKTVALRTASLTGATAVNYALTLAGAPTTTASILAATPPTAPRDVAAAPGDRSVAVTWAAPASAGCGAITGYVVEHSADAGRSWSARTLAGASPTAAVLSGLANNVAHLVRVAATNACGTGAYAVIGPVVPVAPTVDVTGTLATSAPGTATATTGGVAQPVTTEIVQDTIVRVGDGDFTLRLRASDQAGVVIPVDSSRTLQLEQGGRATASGTGFAPGTFVSTYLYTASRRASLLGTDPVAADGAFTTTRAIPDSLAAGSYTLQVNGIDRTSRPRSIGVGVEVVPPAPELDLAATPDEPSPAVGDTITITLTVTNRGRGAATDVVIPRAFHEPGFTIVRTTPIDGTYAAATQEWTIPRIEPGARARMLLTVVVLPPATPQGSTP